MIVRKSLVPAGVIAAVSVWAGMLTLNGVLVLVMGLPFKWLWNAALPGLLSVPYITYTQSSGILGLTLLVRVVVRGIKLKLDFHL